MTTEVQKETRAFQAEARQLLRLVVHSLYSNREIFLRELIANASDACDRLRFEALSDESLSEGDPALWIRVSVDEEARTITIEDNGIGMSRDDVVDNIGTIARSGTRQFLETLGDRPAEGLRLIGQFGVGFYSAFVAAERVVLCSRRAGQPAGQGVRWASDGEGEYTLETIERPSRGTEIVLHLREDADEFLEPGRLRDVIRRHSDHLSLPILMPDASGKGGEWEQINRGSALWARSRQEITDDEYRAFYRHVAHDFEDPLAWVHSQVEGSQSYASLLYIPRQPPLDLWERERHHGIRLHVRRIFVLEDTSGRLMPNYLRFVRGVVDSDDLPLNVSREMLQENRQIDVIRAASVKRVLGRLEVLAGEDPDAYRAFWQAYGRVLKEGLVEDPANRETLAGLLRFHSTGTDGEQGSVSLADYVARMAEGQDRIWFLVADSQAAALSSPHLEAFRSRSIEVLLLWDRVDEWMLTGLAEFDGRPLASVARGELDAADLGETAGTEGEAQGTDGEAGAGTTDDPLLEQMAAILGDEVAGVRASRRLDASASCLVVDSDDLSLGLRRLLESAGQEVPHRPPILEVNMAHPLVGRLRVAGEAETEALTRLLHEQALLVEGGQLPDPAGFVRRVNALLLPAESGGQEGPS